MRQERGHRNCCIDSDTSHRKTRRLNFRKSYPQISEKKGEVCRSRQGPPDCLLVLFGSLILSYQLNNVQEGCSLRFQRHWVRRIHFHPFGVFLRHRLFHVPGHFCLLWHFMKHVGAYCGSIPCITDLFSPTTVMISPLVPPTARFWHLGVRFVSN
jgi:hypothetical protein